jgi:flagellar export protein FliJ
MEQYQFRLQKLLDIRADKEEESKRNFKEAQSEKIKVEEKLNNLKESYNKYREMTGEESVIERKIKHVYLNAINYNITETSKELKVKERVLEDRREDLKLKQIDRKTVEALKEKQKAEFIKEQELKEQQMNDEFALYAFIRKQNSL